MHTEDCSVPMMSHTSSPDEDNPEGIKKQKKDHIEEKTNEDIYCKVLADRLQHVVPPVTVGFYAEWGRSKRKLLDKIEDHMSREEQNKDEGGGVRLWIPLISFIWRVMFFIPGLIHTKPQKARYIFINFNAWEFVGCDYTWAGLIATLLDEVEGKNKVPFSVFRAFGREPLPAGKRWVLRSWRIGFFFGALCLLLCIPLCLAWLDEFTLGNLVVGIGPALATLTYPFIKTMINYLDTLKRQLQREMNKQDLSTKLGFMHSVKEEVKTLIRFLQFMAFYKEQEIRVVLKITNLDVCAPEKVVAVLDAMNILLSDKEAPFISILAADSRILVECIDEASKTPRNGYLHLDLIVTLPFSLPRMSYKAKSQILNEILEEGSNSKQRTKSPEEKGRSNKEDKSSLTQNEINLVLQCLNEKEFDEYIPGNSIQIKRVVNTALITLSMLKRGFQPSLRSKTDGVEKLQIKEVVEWVILATYWPCRLSWILQCEEDDSQRRMLKKSQAGGSQLKESEGSFKTGDGNPDGKGAEDDGSKSLLASFNEYAEELYKYKDEIKKLLELDRDPDLFTNFLQNKNYFTVKRASYFYDLLINLDFSLKRQFELLRGQTHIIMEETSCHKLGGKS